MRIFKHPSGYLVTVGFDPVKGEEATGSVWWKAPLGGEWEWQLLQEPLEPEFVVVGPDCFLLIEGPLGYRFTLVGEPWVWTIERMASEQIQVANAA